jgi:predicted DNA-binding protein with PD1-like motif
MSHTSVLPERLPSSGARFFAVRLKPGEDLLAGIRAVVNEKQLRAVAVVTCVGSLTRANLRYAHTGKWVERTGYFEIVSLVGTVDAVGEHLHIGLADSEGVSIGAHFGLGSSVFTTAEVILAELQDFDFSRELCPLSGYEELVIEPRSAANQQKAQ